MPMLKRLCSVACSALYFWLAQAQVPEICVILLARAGLPARYGPGSDLAVDQLLLEVRHGDHQVRAVLADVARRVSTLLAGSWYSIVRFHCCDFRRTDVRDPTAGWSRP